MKAPRKSVISLLTLASLLSSAGAVTIANFTFVPTDLSNTAASVTGISAVSPITSGPGMTGTGGDNGYTTARGYSSGIAGDISSGRSANGHGGANGSFFVRGTGADGTSLEEAINGGRTITPSVGAAFTTEGGDYFGFTVTVAPGYQLNIESLTFMAARNNDGTPASVSLLTSINGFTALNSVNDFSITSINAGAGTYQSFTSAGITGAAYDALGEGTHEFRFYVYNATALNNPTRFDNIVLDGEVTLIPEPSSFLMTLLAGTSLLRRSRSQA